MRAVAVVWILAFIWGCAPSDKETDTRAVSERMQHDEQLQQQRCAALGDLNCQ